LHINDFQSAMLATSLKVFASHCQKITRQSFIPLLKTYFCLETFLDFLPSK
jgi:hypothetical protein